MPRRTIQLEQSTEADRALSQKLATALKSPKPSGQPLIYEQELGPERLRITVVWDEWDGTPMDERTVAILKAYDLAEGKATRDRIALANGFTVPEAAAAGILPYQVSTALRDNDPVTFEQVRDAMLGEGASTLFGPYILQLRFATREEAETCRQRLIERLPESKDIWIINMEISIQDRMTLSDSPSIDD